METVAPTALLVALVFTVVNWLRYLSGQDWNAVVTQLCVWIGGVVSVLLFAQTDFAGALIPGTAISFEVANGWSLLFIGLQIGSSASVVTEVVKAVDNTRTSAKPKLLRLDPPATD